MHGTIRENDSREGNRRELAALEPVHRCSVDRNSLLGADVRTILEIAVLALLLGLEIQTRETAQVLLDNRLVDSCAAPDTFTVVVCNPTLNELTSSQAGSRTTTHDVHQSALLLM